MPYLPTAQAFLEQSRLLISARPTTARISTKYTLPNLDPAPSKYKPNASRSKKALSTTADGTQTNPPKATLTLKTYDPASGTCLKYETDKGAEVGRLVAALSSCGRVMSALPDKEEGAIKVEDGVKDEVSKEPEGKGESMVKDAKPQAKGGEKGGAGGGGKKKKGKR